jgi:hypothetical protein
MFMSMRRDAHMYISTGPQQEKASKERKVVTAYQLQCLQFTVCIRQPLPPHLRV